MVDYAVVWIGTDDTIESTEGGLAFIDEVDMKARFVFHF